MPRWLPTLLVCLGAALPAPALTLAWDPSPDASVAGYRLYAGTNSLALSPTNALVQVDAGTNLTVTLDALAPARWHFVATAYARSTNGTNIVTLESLPSNEVIVDVPPAPPNLRTLAVQWSGSIVSTNWRDAGFFRLQLTDH